LFIFSLLYPCVNLNFLYVFFFSGQGLVEHIFVHILWDYGWKLGEKEKKMMLDEKNWQSCQRSEKKKRKTN